MTDEELVSMLRKRGGKYPSLAADRIEALTAERDRAYSTGYSDAETEISKSALGQDNTFLHSQYANAKIRIEALTAQMAEVCVERDEFLNSAWRNGIDKQSAEADNERLREVVLEADKLIGGDLTGLQWKRECRSFRVWARAVLRGETT